MSIISISSSSYMQQWTYHTVKYGLPVLIATAATTVVPQGWLQQGATLIGTCGLTYLCASLVFSTKIKSALDDDKMVTQEMWAITLTRLKNHAQIFIEGVNEHQQYFSFIADVRAKGTVETNLNNYGVNITPIVFANSFNKRSNIKWDAKTPTWLVTREKIKKLSERLQQEQASPSFMFDIVGKDGFLTTENAHNCITWAIEQVNVLEEKQIKEYLEERRQNIISTFIKYTSPETYIP